jgi:hypothetical protein
MWIIPSTPVGISLVEFSDNLEGRTGQGSDDTKETDGVHNSRILPSTQALDESVPHKAVGVPRGEANEDSDSDGQEDDMHDSRSDLNGPHNTTSKYVDNNRNYRNCPHKQGTAPSFHFILRVCQHNHALDFGSDEVWRDTDESAPRKDSHPT